MSLLEKTESFGPSACEALNGTQFDSLDLRFLPVEISCDGRYQHLGVQPFVQPLADAEMTLTSHAQMLLNFMSACEWKLIYYDIQKHVKVITLSFFLWKLAFTVFDTSLEALSQPTSVSRTCCTCLLLSSRFQQTQSLLCFACRCNCQT